MKLKRPANERKAKVDAACLWIRENVMPHCEIDYGYSAYHGEGPQTTDDINHGGMWVRAWIKVPDEALPEVK